MILLLLPLLFVAALAHTAVPVEVDATKELLSFLVAAVVVAFAVAVVTLAVVVVPVAADAVTTAFAVAVVTIAARHGRD